MHERQGEYEYKNNAFVSIYRILYDRFYRIKVKYLLDYQFFLKYVD